jgi:hypothetical protein
MRVWEESKEGKAIEEGVLLPPGMNKTRQKEIFLNICHFQTQASH